MTQLEMTTSTDPSGSGMSSMVPLRNSTLATPASAALAPRQLQHLVGHVDAVREAGLADPPGGEEYVDAAARAEVEHPLALLQLRDGGRVAAAEAGRDGLDRELALEVGGIERGAEGLTDLHRLPAARSAAVGDVDQVELPAGKHLALERVAVGAAGEHCLGRRGVPLAHHLAGLLL